MDKLVNTLPMKDWGNIALDLFFKHGTPEEIATTYGLSTAEFLSLIKTPQFKQIFSEVKQRMNAMGENASVVMRARAAVEYLMSDMIELAMDVGTDPKDKIKLFTILLNLSDLNKPAVPEHPTSTVPVIIQFHNVPGMEHLRPAIEHDMSA